MIDYKFGHVILVTFPFTDQSGSKKRPAVIVSSDAYNRIRRDLILMAITSQFRKPSVLGDIKISEWKKSGLLKPSIIKPVMVTIEHSLVIKSLGQLEPVDCQLLRDTLRLILG
ncbi:MAG: type II toxin-antitoxin system PemK/MazF family toxin [Acidobacteria bacterium]|nr:type II toxin-antitoxin system PemK/MazF family toxin [Acidobacteriota bacterium]